MTDHIRKHLERHGYTEESLSGGRRQIGSQYVRTWPQALDHFLADTSKTGARIQDLCDNGPGKEIGPVQIYGTGYFDSEDPTNEEKHWRGYCTYASDGPTPSPTGDAKTVDASVADCWRRIFIDQEQP